MILPPPTTKSFVGSVFERHMRELCSMESLARHLFFIVHMHEKPYSQVTTVSGGEEQNTLGTFFPLLDPIIAY